jgi:hypothetical protein
MTISVETTATQPDMYKRVFIINLLKNLLSRIQAADIDRRVFVLSFTLVLSSNRKPRDAVKMITVIFPLPADEQVFFS